jgi:membrane protein YqaA with SNARE-associated domain
MMKRLKSWIDVLQSHVNNWWYAPALALVAFLDLFVLVIPTDALLISGTMLAPRRWIFFASVVALGSSAGAWLLAAILQVHGLPFLLHYAPNVMQSHAWSWSIQLMDAWGLWAVLFISVGPIIQHPIVALAAITGMSLYKIFFLVLTGRLIKYLFIAWVSTHAPGLLSKIWVVNREIKAIDLNPEKIDSK